MYIERDTNEFDLAVLRQGDILTGIPFALLDHTQLQVLGKIKQDQEFNVVPPITTSLITHRGDGEWTSATVPVRFGFCAVVSNCCDLEPHNGRIQGHAIMLARLQPIPTDIRRNEANFESLKANKDPRNKANAGYMDYFYLEAHEKLLDQDWRVHLNQMVCLPTSDIALLLGRKVLQLDDRTRAKFKFKIGAKFSRMTDDELAQGLDDPWNEALEPGA